MVAVLTRPVTATCAVEPGWIHVDAPYTTKPRLDAIRAKWDAGKRQFRLPLTWANCLALRTEFGDDLELDPSLVDFGRQYLTHAQPLVDLRGQHSRKVRLPDHLPGIERLFKHQRAGVDLILRSARMHADLKDLPGARYLILDQTGTGKTDLALAAASVLDDQSWDVFPLIIVCPKSVIRAWSVLAEAFFPGRDVREVHGAAAKVRKVIEPGGDVYILSYDTLRRYSRIAGYAGAPALTPEQREDKEIQALGAKMLIVDEVHRASNPATLQTRAAWAVADHVDHVIALTGTPIQDSPENLWSILRLLDKRSFATKTGYRDRYLDVVINPFGGYDVRGLQHATAHEFFAQFHALSRRAEKAEVLPFLPPKIYSTRWVELPPDNRRAYKQMAQQYLLEVESGEVTSAANPMVAATRLIQLANSTLDVLPPPAEDEPEIVRMVNPSPKVKAFMGDLLAGDYDDTSVVVFSDSRQLLDLCAEAMASEGIDFVSITGDTATEDRNTAIARFQSGEVRFILISRAGDTGITLSRASVMVRLTRAWSYITHTQAEDRVHRIGSEQHTSIEYIDYITMDTVEEGQIVRLNEKGERATAVLHPDELLDLLKGSK